MTMTSSPTPCCTLLWLHTFASTHNGGIWSSLFALISQDALTVSRSAYFYVFFFFFFFFFFLPPCWPSGQGVRLGSERPEVRIPLATGFFWVVIPVAYKLALQWLPCQAPGIIGSVLGLVSLVSVYCDCVR